MKMITLFKVAGARNVTTDIIRNTPVDKIKDPKKVITGCKSSYESIAKENNWNLKQVKSKCYKDNEGNTLANINSLHSELTMFLSRFHGVSTKHLQEYLNWFAFSKYQNYSINYVNQADDFEKKTITKSTKNILMFVITIAYLIFFNYIKIIIISPQNLQHSGN